MALHADERENDSGRAAMTGLERYVAVLRGQPADVLPRVPILMRFAAEYAGARYDAFCTDHRVKSEANLRCAEAFGVDVVSVMSDPLTEAADRGAEVTFHADATPECPRPPLERCRDLDNLADPDPRTAPRMSNTIRTVQAYRKRAAGQRCILGWVEGPLAEAADLRGAQQIMMDLYDDPAWVEQLMDRCVALAIDFAQAQVEAGADTIGIGDALASQISRDLYERYVLPREHQLMTAIRAMGAVTRMHICGDITHLLPAMAQLPVDVLDVDSMVDLSYARATMPAQVALGCNVDPVAVVMRGTPGSIRQAIEALYRTVGNPLLVNAGCEIPPGTPHENLRALCNPVAWRE